MVRHANLCRRIACEPRGTHDVRMTALEAAAQHGVPLLVAMFCYSEPGDGSWAKMRRPGSAPLGDPRF